MRCCLLTILLYLPAFDASAQAAMPQVSTSEADRADDAETLDTVTVTGVARSLRRLPGSVSIVDAGTLRGGQRQVNLSEPLQRVPGFTALDRQNYAQDLQIQSRGFGARSTFGIRGIRLIVDGIPSSAADGQGQAAAFPLSSLDRIEVLRGPLALQFGNAAGGVILGISDLGGTPGMSAEAWAGRDSRRASVRIDSGDDDDAWRWRASGSAFATDGARPHSAARRTQVNVIGEWSRSEGERLRVVYNGLRQPLAEDPLGLTRDAFARDPGSTDPSALAFDTRKTVREDQFGLRWQRDDASGGGRWLSAYRVERAIEQFLAVPVAAQRAPGSAGGVIDLGRGSTGIDVGQCWANARGSIALGIEAVRLDEARRGYENFVGDRLGVRGRLRRDEHNRVDAFDLYGAGDFRFGEDWTVSLGARRAALRFGSDDRYLANGDDSGARRDVRTAWSFGAVRAFAQGEIHASYGRGFETPTLNERAYRPDGASGFNRDLRAADLRSFEVGARWRGDRGDASLALYRVDGEDEIVPALNRGGRASFANAGATRREGIEFGAAGQFGANWGYALAASWIDARFVDGFAFAVANGPLIETRIVEAGNRIPGIPRADLFAEWTWRSDDGRWSSALEGRWLGEIATDDRNTDAARGHARFAWRGQWHARRDRGWYAFLRIDNLTDRSDAGSVIVNEANGRYFEPDIGRSATIAIGWSGRR
ncbi:MAG: TonB-dependent receptor [Xanthomonadales bacterium]|nr:TonB-dependent receptor [Xanthomonadales bacterium]